MDNLQIFSNSEFGEVRTVIVDGEPWFCGRDVATALGYSKPETSVRDRVNIDDTEKFGIIDALGREQQTLFINEAGLYILIFGSKLESARKFQDWVMHEVLPSIRKTGTYTAPTTVPATTSQQIQLLAKGYTELEERIDKIDSRFLELPLFPNELQAVNLAAKRKGVEVMGGKKSPAYHDRGLCITIYRDIYGEIHRNFGIPSYRDLRRTDVPRALDIINAYRLPMVLADRVTEANEAA